MSTVLHLQGIYHQLNGGEVYGRANDDGCELFGAAPDGDDSDELCPQAQVPPPDELHEAHSPIAPLQQAQHVAARCVNGTLIRPSNVEGDHPSTACQQSEVHAQGGVQLGRGSPGQQQSSGGSKRPRYRTSTATATPTSSSFICHWQLQIQ